MSQEFLLGSLVLVQQAKPSSPLPLERTSVSGDILGGAAAVRVVQRFSNPYPQPIEVEYLFPLPHTAAISGYAITIGPRTIQAEVREREAAQRAYDEAQAEGKRASLLLQQRPNLFALRVANIQPGEAIVCTIHYDEPLTYTEGQYEFVFPMGLTPRYHTPILPADPAVDAPVAPPEAKIGPVDITLNLHGAFADPVSPTHALSVTQGEHRTVTLAEDTIPNKDFVLRFAVAADTVRPSVWATGDDGDSEIALLSLLPPRFLGTAVTAKREFVFVIDRSGSMGGDPIEQAHNALKTCLRMLNAEDRFWILVFDDRLEWFAQVPMALTQEAVDAADAWISQAGARGGTAILAAITAALDLPVDPERQRYVVFLTDGAVSAEDAALREITAKRRNAKIFTFGLGPSVNRYLINKMAVLGRGQAEFLGVNDDLEAAITRFQDRVSYPALEDIQLEWRGARVWDTYPDAVADLYVGQPLTIVTRFARTGTGAVTVIARGQRSGATIEFRADVPKGDQPLLRRLWARARIEALTDLHVQDATAARQEIIALALKYGLASRYTAFVAVDSEVTTGGADHLVQIAVPLPEGLRSEGFGGGAGGAGAPLPSATMHFMPSAPVRQITLSIPAAAPPPAPVDKAKKELDLPAFLRKSRVTQRLDDNLAQFEPEFEQASEPPLSPLERLQQVLAANSGQPEVLVKLLARQQMINGSWVDDVALTARVLLIFINAGHTTVTGAYRVQVRKAAQWLVQAVKAGSPVTEAQAALTALSAVTGEQFL